MISHQEKESVIGTTQQLIFFGEIFLESFFIAYLLGTTSPKQASINDRRQKIIFNHIFYVIYNFSFLITLFKRLYLLEKISSKQALINDRRKSNF